MTIGRCALFVFIVSLSTQAFGQATPQPRAGELESSEPAQQAAAERQPGTSSQVREALTRLHDFNSYVVEAGEIAQRNSTSQEIQSYGRMLVRDHRAADADTRALAAERNLDLTASTVDDGLEREQRAALERLQGLQGIAFDEVFLPQMAADHEAAIQDLHDALLAAQDAEVRDAETRDLLHRVLLMLQDHRNAALSLSDQTAQAGH